MELSQSLAALVIFLVSCSHTVFAYTVKLVVVNREAHDYDGITCWTCPNKTDNEACNDWAPDILCPYGHSWCRTQHRINTLTGESILVDKQCVMPEQCRRDVIGCHPGDLPGVQDCISCCNEDYCNEHVPSNHTAAFMLSSYHGNSSAILESHVLLLRLAVLVGLMRAWLGV